MGYNLSMSSSIKFAKKYQEESMKEEKAKLVMIAKTVIEGLKNGILCEDGRVRKFDYIDYYNMCSFSLDKLFYIVKDSFNAEEVKLFRTFQLNNARNDRLALYNVLNAKNTYDVKLDENGNIIPGSGREVTREEIENIIDYMITNNYPFTKVVYETLFNRWRYGFVKLPTKFYDDGQSRSR